MYWGLIVVCLLIYGCVNATINVSSGTGKHDVGPDDASSWRTDKDTQENSDTVMQLDSKVSGVDGSTEFIDRRIVKESLIKQHQDK